MITKEKLKVVEICTLSTDFYEKKDSETAVHRFFIEKLNLKNWLKGKSNPFKMQSLEFQK